MKAVRKLEFLELNMYFEDQGFVVIMEMTSIAIK